MRRHLRRTIILSVFVAIFLPVFCAHAENGGIDEDLLHYLKGKYRLIGQSPKSGAPYAGYVTLSVSGDKFIITRIIGNKAVKGSAQVEQRAAGPVLKLEFPFQGVPYEAVYLWRSDLDNYPRMSGYVYRADGGTDSPGLEALFSIPPTPDE